MNEFTGGLWLYVLFFAVIALLNFSIRRIEAWLKRERQAPQPPEPAHSPRAVENARARPAAAREPATRTEAPAVSRTARTASSARSLVSGRRNLRRAVIAMTILGPCRSQDP